MDLIMLICMYIGWIMSFNLACWGFRGILGYMCWSWDSRFPNSSCRIEECLICSYICIFTCENGKDAYWYVLYLISLWFCYNSHVIGWIHDVVMYGSQIQEVWVVKPMWWMVKMPKTGVGFEFQNRLGQTEHELQSDQSCLNAQTREMKLLIHQLKFRRSMLSWIEWWLQMIRPRGARFMLGSTEGAIEGTKKC